MRTLVEGIKDLLEKNFSKKVENLGINSISSELESLEDVVEYQFLDTDEEKKKFEIIRNNIWVSIKSEANAMDEKWDEAYFWFIDQMVYSFFNRIFSIRIMEELELLKESTFKPQADLGNRSARMAKIQEMYSEHSEEDWIIFLLKDVFSEISEEIKILFSKDDATTQIWPDAQTIEIILDKFNSLSSEIYKAEDCIGWFYHYYVLKFRKGHKTMSSHGSKSPKNPHYLSILNTVYTPRWMVRILVDNSLGHWWLNHNPESVLFLDSPFFIKKVPTELKLTTDDPKKLKILDPACGSGNFLVYAFSCLIDIYQEKYPKWALSKIITSILTNNLYGIDINRRPAQLSALALFIISKRFLKEKSPEELKTFQMPVVNIICCDIRTPSSKAKTLLLYKIPEQQKKIMNDVLELFNNADQLGSLIDIRGLQNELDKLRKTSLDKFMDGNEQVNLYDLQNLVETVLGDNDQNIGLQIFGSQAKSALSLAQLLMYKYDIIMGNPPFGLMIDSTKTRLRKQFPYSYGDLVSSFVDQSLRLLKPNGYIAMVTDFSFLHLPKFEKFRLNILLLKSYIQYLMITGLGALPNARNVPTLFITRKFSITNESIKGLYRYVEYNSSQQFQSNIYISHIKEDIKSINFWDESTPFPKGWNRIPQKKFLLLPRAVIDLTIEEKYEPLLAFFKQNPRLDYNQLKAEEKLRIKIKNQIARSFHGLISGNNNKFIRIWHEIYSNKKIVRDQFLPFSKGGGDIRYYLNNTYLIWWNEKSIEMMKNEKGALSNLKLVNNSNLHWSKASGKPRGRFNISQKGLILGGSSMGIKIQEDINKFALLSYLNSKFCVFFGRLQTKDRKWQPGTIARFPILLDFLKKSSNLKTLSEESYSLRRLWDTGYPMSPIFTESLIDKVLSSNNNKKLLLPETGHPFCEEYYSCESETAKRINTIRIDPRNKSFKTLIDTVFQRFSILTNRLDKIDNEIDKILYELISESTQQALNEYYKRYIGELEYIPEPDIWLKDFLMANIIDTVKNSKRGILTMKNYRDEEDGLYSQFIKLLCQKFVKEEQNLRPFLDELRLLLGKTLEEWIKNDFFFYHCQRFGGRPIIWQLTSKKSPKSKDALNLFMFYHRLNQNTLSTIRVDYVQPILKIHEQNREAGIISEDDMFKFDELNDFLRTILELEEGYREIPNANSLTGKKTIRGKGDDKTWEWVFGEAAKIIKNGYKPDLFKGVLVNLIPLCLNIPDNKKDKFDIQYHSLCPRGTIKKILKKLDTLDQLKQTSIRTKK